MSNDTDTTTNGLLYGFRRELEGFGLGVILASTVAMVVEAGGLPATVLNGLQLAGIVAVGLGMALHVYNRGGPEVVVDDR